MVRARRTYWHSRLEHGQSVASEFCTTVLTQAQLLTLNHEQHLNYEFSHILMFTTAIVYAKAISAPSLTLNLTLIIL